MEPNQNPQEQRAEQRANIFRRAVEAAQLIENGEAQEGAAPRGAMEALDAIPSPSQVSPPQDEKVPEQQIDHTPKETPPSPEMGDSGSSGVAVRPREEVGAPYSPSSLKITEECMEKFMDCLTMGQPYSEDFVIKFGKNVIGVTIRDRLGSERDFTHSFISWKLFNQKVDALTHQTEVNKALMLAQLVSFDGNKMPGLYVPPRPWSDETFEKHNIITQFETSVLGQMPESLFTILSGKIVQFTDKVRRIQIALVEGKENFSDAGDPS